MNKRLVDLDPMFIKRTEAERMGKVATLAEADGILFDCPMCVGPGSHSIHLWFRGKVPDGMLPGPGRWDVSGTGFADLTLAPSVNMQPGCPWHGFIQNGVCT